MPAPKKSKATVNKTFDMALLASLVAVTQAGNYMFTSPEQHEPMVEAGVAEINPSTVDGNGGIATRATVAGIEAVNADTTARPAAAKDRPTFEIDSDVVKPHRRRFGSNPGVYPFDALEVGQSFFIPATEERPNVAKAMASTISSANKRYMTHNEDGSKTHNRKFSIVNVEVDEKKGVAGARIFRDQ